MTIKQLLEAHDQNQTDQTLSNCLGDAYLFHHNPVYNKIRKITFQLSYQFQTPPDLAYLALPFTQLENILDSKVIPYFDNVTVLRHLPQTLAWQSVQDSLRKNYVFHESCHAVARNQTQHLLSQNNDQDELIFLRLVEESFANTIELISLIYSDHKTHRFFYQINSFTSLFENQSQFKKASDELGSFDFFHMMMMGYIYSNFLKTSLNEPEFHLICDLAFQKKPRKVPDKALKSLLKIPFTLDLDFRLQTTPLHLLLNGHKADLKKISIPDLLVKHQVLIKSMIHEALPNP
jgi:hypothetical protein